MCMLAMPWRIEDFLGFGKVGWFGNVNKMAGIRFLDVHGRNWCCCVGLPDWECGSVASCNFDECITLCMCVYSA